MHRTTICTVLATVLSIGAAYVSFNLLAKHLSGAKGPSWFDAGCSDDPNSAANCGAVLASPYSYWPPRLEGVAEGTRHLPVALLGLFYYSALTVWFVGVGAPGRSRRFWHLLPLAFIACGLLASVNYIYIMFTKLDHWCVWCLVTHGMNLAIAVLAVLMWPRLIRKDEATEVPAREGTVTGSSARSVSVAEVPVSASSPHPSMRHVATALVAALAIMWGQYHLYDKARFQGIALQNKTFFDQCRAMVDRLKSDPSNLLASWKRGEECSIPLRPDEAIRTDAAPGEPTLHLVEFSDLECPSCKRFAIMLERDIQPLFDNKLSIVYRNHPLDSECNPRVARTMHPHACEASKMAEAARVLGGPDKFWLAYDHLFNGQSELEKGKVDAAWLAQRIGVNVDELEATMASPEILERIGEDIDQAANCNVRSTPTVFVEGKLVDSIARNDIKFWDQLANEFWARQGVPRPAHTRLAAREATRDSQDRSAGR